MLCDSTIKKKKKKKTFTIPNGSDSKESPVMQKTKVQSLGQEDPLEEGMATHASIFAWRIPWTEEPGGGHSPWGHKEWDTTERLTLSLSR